MHHDQTFCSCAAWDQLKAHELHLRSRQSDGEMVHVWRHRRREREGCLGRETRANQTQLMEDRKRVRDGMRIRGAVSDAKSQRLGICKLDYTFSCKLNSIFSVVTFRVCVLGCVWCSHGT